MAVYFSQMFHIYIQQNCLSYLVWIWKKRSFVFLVPTVCKYLTYSLLHTSDVSSLCTGDTHKWHTWPVFLFLFFFGSHRPQIFLVWSFSSAVYGYDSLTPRTLQMLPVNLWLVWGFETLLSISGVISCFANSFMKSSWLTWQLSL
jgi:hypothetical protein